MRTVFPVSLVLTFFTGIGTAEDAAKIVEQYIKAAGGAQRISKIQTLEMEGTITRSANGKAGTFTFDTKLPNRYYSELVADDKSWIEAYNGKSAWHQATGELSTLLGQQGQQLRRPAVVAREPGEHLAGTIP